MTGIQNNSGSSKIKDDLSFTSISLSYPCDEVVLLWEIARTNSCHGATQSWAPRFLISCWLVIIKTLPSSESLKMKLHSVYIPAYRIGEGENMTQKVSTQVPSEPQRPKPLRSPAQVEGTQGFLPQPGKALERPPSTRLEARFPYHGSGAMTRSPSPLAWRPDFPGAPREAH